MVTKASDSVEISLPCPHCEKPIKARCFVAQGKGHQYWIDLPSTRLIHSCQAPSVGEPTEIDSKIVVDSAYRFE